MSAGGRDRRPPGYEARARASNTAMSQAVATRDQLAQAGFDMKILSGGSTGTYHIDGTKHNVTELQVGSYVFMDVCYRRLGGQSSPAFPLVALLLWDLYLGLWLFICAYAVC